MMCTIRTIFVKKSMFSQTPHYLVTNWRRFGRDYQTNVDWRYSYGQWLRQPSIGTFSEIIRLKNFWGSSIEQKSRSFNRPLAGDPQLRICWGSPANGRLRIFNWGSVEDPQLRICWGSPANGRLRIFNWGSDGDLTEIWRRSSIDQKLENSWRKVGEKLEILNRPIFEDLRPISANTSKSNAVSNLWVGSQWTCSRLLALGSYDIATLSAGCARLHWDPRMWASLMEDTTVV